MVFKFGKKINDKIEAQLKPAIGTPCNPYDLFEGKLFALHITKKQKWNNYDSCEFVGDKCSLTIAGETTPIQKNKEDMAKVLGWLKENSPELDKYEYKEWTDEITEKVFRAIKNIIPDGRLVEQILSAAKSDRPSTGNASYIAHDEAKSTHTQDSINDVANAPKKEVAKPKAEKANVGINDLYDGL